MDRVDLVLRLFKERVINILEARLLLGVDHLLAEANNNNKKEK